VQRISCITIICFAYLHCAFADDFKTTNGEEYKNVTVSRVEPDGIVVTFSAGIVKIPFTDLSPELQKKYGYDPKSAATYAADLREKEAQFQRQLKEQENQRTAEREKYWREHSAPVPALNPSGTSQPVVTSMHGSALDQRPAEKTLIYGRISATVEEGILIRVHGSPVVGQERIPSGAEVLLLGKFPGFYDNDKVQVLGVLAGTRDHVTLSSRATLHETVRAFEPAQINKLAEFPSNVREY
jgi:hypothetical protein